MRAKHESRSCHAFFPARRGFKTARCSGPCRSRSSCHFEQHDHCSTDGIRARRRSRVTLVWRDPPASSPRLTSMSQVLQLAVPLATSFAAIGSFAYLRRVMRSSRIPRFLDNDPIAYAVAMIFTIIFCASMVVALYSLLAIIPNVMPAFVAAIALHLAMWALMRVLVPLASDDRHIVPAAAPGVVPAH